MNADFTDEDVLKKNHKIFFRIMPLFIIVGILVCLFGATDRTLHCTYGGANGYACQTNLKIFAFNLGTDNFTNITEAVLVSSKRSGSTSRTTYQMQFVNKSGQKLQYTRTWISMYGKVNKEVAAVNKHFADAHDFNYTFVRNKLLIFFGLFFVIVPMLMLFFTMRITNDNGFKDFDAKKFLAQKDLSKMSEEEILSFIKQRNDMGK